MKYLGIYREIKDPLKDGRFYIFLNIKGSKLGFYKYCGIGRMESSLKNKYLEYHGMISKGERKIHKRFAREYIYILENDEIFELSDQEEAVILMFLDMEDENN